MRQCVCRLAVAAALLALAAPAPAERVKDIVEIQGIRGNPLWGYGLVIGLNGTGDDSETSRRALTNILRRSDLVLNPKDLSSKNIASVLVTTELPPFAREGSYLDVTVSVIGDATSLQGGMLLMTPLMGADGQVYAVAQGAVSIGGFSATGQSASVTQNHTTVGRIPSGATVERAELATFLDKGSITLQLRNPDFATSRKIAEAVNGIYPDSAVAMDPGSVRVKVPGNMPRTEIAAFVDSIQMLQVKVDYPAVVVINERTGTVVVGQNVGISTVAISHGNLSIVTQEKEFVSQAAPFSEKGTTEKVNRTEITAQEGSGALHVVDRKVSVSELARALNAMGLTPRDLIAIFEALRQAGALQADIRIM